VSQSDWFCLRARLQPCRKSGDETDTALAAEVHLLNQPTAGFQTTSPSSNPVAREATRYQAEGFMDYGEKFWKKFIAGITNLQESKW
jgi:hypothetical protein